MKKTHIFQNTYILLSLLGFLFLVFIFDGTAFFSAEKNSKLFPQLVEENISEIIIDNKSGKVLTLVKENNEWFIEAEKKHSADPQTIKFMINTLLNLSSENVASSNPQNHQLFEVGEQNFAVTLGMGEQKSTFYIGKAGPSFSSGYIRLADQNEVYLVYKNLKMTFDTDAERLRNKMMLSFEPALINRFSLESKEKNIKLARKDEKTWVEELGQQEKQGVKVDSFLKNLSPVQASSFPVVAEGQKYNTDEATAEMKVSFERNDGKIKTLLIGKSENRYYGKFTDSEEIFELDPSYIEKLTTDI